MEMDRAVSPHIAQRKTLIRITLTALFAALTAGGSFVVIPLPGSPVPIVLQNMFILLSGLILGPLLGTAAVGLYLLAGVLGAPVFAGIGGIAKLLGPNGGFYAGYPLMALLAGCIVGRPKAETHTPGWRLALAVIAGTLAVYVPGVTRLKFALDYTWTATIAVGFLPFIIGDTLKGIAAGLIAPRLRRLIADHLDG